jgi:hypothetical protein
MPLIRYFETDPGQDVRTEVTSINLIGKLATGQPSVPGPNVVGLIGALVNDRGNPDVPRIISGVPEMARTYGGWNANLGEGSASGYEGNLYMRSKGLFAGGQVVLCPVNMAIQKTGGTEALIKLQRGAATGDDAPYTIPAGTMIADAAAATATVICATLEDASWAAGEEGAGEPRSVRFRYVQNDEEYTVPKAAPSTIADVAALDTILDAPTDPAGGTATITTVADATLMIDYTAAPTIQTRYSNAMAAMLTTDDGLRAKLLVCDVDDASIMDDLTTHCRDASSAGYFRQSFISPPVGTTVALAKTGGSDSVNRATLLDQYVHSYCFPGWQVQRPEDSDNLTAPYYRATIPSAVSRAFLASHFMPEENSANPNDCLRTYGIVGVESLAIAPTRTELEQVGIQQPVMEATSLVGGGLNPSFHADVTPYFLTGATKPVKAYTTRMAFYLYTGFLTIALRWHKRPAKKTNRDGFLRELKNWLMKLQKEERIGLFADPIGTWDGDADEFFVQLAEEEIGNQDVISILNAYGSASAVGL